MARAMAGSGGDWTVLKIRYPAVHFSQLQTKQLHQLITLSSTAAMNSLGLDTTTVLATNDPQIWNGIRSFPPVAAVVKSVRVVNSAKMLKAKGTSSS